MRKNKQTGKNAKTAARKLQTWIILLIAVALITLVMVVLQIIRGGSNGSEATGVATGNFQPVPNPTVNIENLDDLESETYKGLQVEKIGNYSGLFMEDGSNDIVSRVLMIIVKNTGNRTVQYGEIQLTNGTTTASFTLSTLPPGESVVLLEKNRMSYEAGKDLTEVKMQNVAVFQQEPTLCEDQLKIQALDGVINVTNISDKDITGDIVIYYKNAASDLLYGGITYRVTIKRGIKAGDIKQIAASHYTANGSRVMWVTVS